MNSLLETTLMLVCAGLGAVARYGVTLLIPGKPSGWPWATFVVNLAGTFLLGFMLTYGTESTAYVLGATGLAGGFTTFSTYNLELVDRGQTRPWMALAYLFASLIGGLACVFLGYQLGLQV